MGVFVVCSVGLVMMEGLFVVFVRVVIMVVLYIVPTTTISQTTEIKSIY